MANKTLIVMSNHPVDNWEQAQTAGWDTIHYLPHPMISADMTGKDLDKLVLKETLAIIDKVDINNVANTYFCIQGDYSFCYRIWKEIEFSLNINSEQFVFPITERKVINTAIKPDGSYTKETVFKFAQWR